MSKKILLFFILISNLLFSMEFMQDRVGETSYISAIIPFSDFVFSRNFAEGRLTFVLFDKRHKEILRQAKPFKLNINSNDRLDQLFLFEQIYFKTGKGSFYLEVHVYDKFGRKRWKSSNPIYVDRKIYKKSKKISEAPSYLLNYDNGTKYFSFYESKARADSLILLKPVSSLENIKISYYKNNEKDSINIDVKGRDLLTKVFANKITKLELSLEDRIKEKKNIDTKISFFKRIYSEGNRLLQIKYIASQEEMKYLRKVPSHSLDKVLQAFWKTKDPTPSDVRNEIQEQFILRVVKADSRYSVRGYKKGWQTDQGMVLIKLGEPDEIEEEVHPLDSYPYIVWHYYSLGKEIVFYDRQGFGHYELQESWKGIDPFFD